MYASRASTNSSSNRETYALPLDLVLAESLSWADDDCDVGISVQMDIVYIQCMGCSCPHTGMVEEMEEDLT